MGNAAKPTHLLEQPDDRQTLCGISLRTPNAATPYMLARHLPMYRRQRGASFAVCADCERQT